MSEQQTSSPRFHKEQTPTLPCGVSHDWDDRRAIRILKDCRQAMGEKGRVRLVDMVVPDTKAESRALLDAADYKLTRIIPTMAPQSLLEAVPRIGN